MPRKMESHRRVFLIKFALLLRYKCEFVRTVTTKQF